MIPRLSSSTIFSLDSGGDARFLEKLTVIVVVNVRFVADKDGDLGKRVCVVDDLKLSRASLYTAAEPVLVAVLARRHSLCKPSSSIDLA